MRMPRRIALLLVTLALHACLAVREAGPPTVTYVNGHWGQGLEDIAESRSVRDGRFVAEPQDGTDLIVDLEGAYVTSPNGGKPSATIGEEADFHVYDGVPGTVAARLTMRVEDGVLYFPESGG